MKNVVIIRSTSIYEDSRTIKLATMLTEFGYNVTVLGWDRKCEHLNEEVKKVNEKSFKIEFFKENCSYGAGIKNIFKMLKFHKWLKNKIKKLSEPTIIHTCDYDTAKPIYKIVKNKHKLIYDIFDFYADTHYLPLGLNKIIKKEELNIINSADATIICTEQRIEQIKGSKPQNLTVIHNTPSFNFNWKKNKPNVRLKICFIGALIQDRLLIEIMREIKNHPEYDFIFGGVGCFEEEIKKLASELDNVEYLGSMPYNKVLDIENACDVLFATYNPEVKNHRYSAPNKFYEAGCLSKPIIVCNNTGVDELVKQYNSGLCIDYSVVDFFEKLNVLNKNRQLLIKLGVE